VKESITGLYLEQLDEYYFYFVREKTLEKSNYGRRKEKTSSVLKNVFKYI
jgi:hypothetical protein